jgi:hypothetical protein
MYYKNYDTYHKLLDGVISSRTAANVGMYRSAKTENLLSASIACQ